MKLLFPVAMMLALPVFGSTISASAARAEEAISCDTFVKAGSELAVLLDSLSPRPKCTRTQDGRKIDMLFVARGIAKERGKEPFHLAVLVRRSNNANQLLSILFPTGYRDFPDELPLVVNGIHTTGSISRHEAAELGNLTFACVSAWDIEVDDSRSNVELCRSTTVQANDAEVLAAAQEIAEKYLPSIKP